MIETLTIRDSYSPRRFRNGQAELYSTQKHSMVLGGGILVIRIAWDTQACRKVSTYRFIDVS